MTWFREGVMPEMLAEVNDCVIGRNRIGKDDEENPPPNEASGCDTGGESDRTPDDEKAPPTMAL